jgi:hypothetical protein
MREVWSHTAMHAVSDHTSPIIGRSAGQQSLVLPDQEVPLGLHIHLQACLRALSSVRCRFLINASSMPNW